MRSFVKVEYRSYVRDCQPGDKMDVLCCSDTVYYDDSGNRSCGECDAFGRRAFMFYSWNNGHPIVREINGDELGKGMIISGDLQMELIG